jgi:hypothetical protein
MEKYLLYHHTYSKRVNKVVALSNIDQKWETLSGVPPIGQPKWPLSYLARSPLPNPSLARKQTQHRTVLACRQPYRNPFFLCAVALLGV